MDRKKSNMKPAVIFTLLVVASLIFGFVSGAIELSIFGEDVGSPETPVENLDYKAE